MIEEPSLKKKIQSKEMKILDPANNKHSAKILKMVRDELAKLVRKKKVKKSNETSFKAYSEGWYN